MKPMFKLYSVAVILALAVASAGSAFALTLSSGQAASLVLGQPNFTSYAANTTQKGMSSPGSVAVDPTTGKVFVSDGANNRVLRFASVASLHSGASAEAVLGQLNFTSSLHATTQGHMYGPASVALDASGRLWVADEFNNRVLRFDHASAKANGANADGVLGQTNFTSSAHATTQSGVYLPLAVAVDGVGRLWVADGFHNRVLRFNAAAAKANGANADGVLGQPNFTSGGNAATQSGMSLPDGLTVDSAGRLWVADGSNNRVLWFDSAAALANGATADGVLGQTNFTNHAAALTQSGMNNPDGVAVDASGRLWVADFTNDRVLGFANAALLAYGANASVVLGQKNFTSNGNAASATGLSLPGQLFVDRAADVLWVADYSNNRVLRYGLAVLTQNGGFNSYISTSKIPYHWSALNFSAADGKDTTVKEEGAASVKIIGAAGKTKVLTQSLAVSGYSGDKFTFSFWARGSSIPTSPGVCEAQVLFYTGTTLLTSQTRTISCYAGTYTTFLKKALTFNTSSSYNKVVIRFTVSKPSGTVWFDAVSLLR
jgi:sugar lactone lactonase YvrE